MKARFISILLIIFIVLGSQALSYQKADWKGTIEYEDGVEVIKNPSDPLYGEITFELEEDLLIEDKDGKDYFFQWVCDVNVDSVGNIYVLDRQQHKAYIFNKNGNYIKTIGGKGQGPGEFNTPVRIYIDGEDRIHVLENRRLHLFDHKADFIKSINFSFPVLSCSLTENGNIMAYSNEIGPEGASQRIYALNPEGEIISTIAERSVSMNDLKNPGPSTDLGPMFYLSPFDKKNSIYGNIAEYKLYEIDSDGTIVQVIERQVSQKKVRYFNGLFNTDTGLIFVDRRVLIKEKGEPIPFDIFNRKGHYIYKAFMYRVSSRPTVKAGYLYEIDYVSDTGAFFVRRFKIKNWDQIKERI